MERRECPCRAGRGIIVTASSRPEPPSLVYAVWIRRAEPPEAWEDRLSTQPSWLVPVMSTRPSSTSTVTRPFWTSATACLNSSTCLQSLEARESGSTSQTRHRCDVSGNRKSAIRSLQNFSRKLGYTAFLQCHYFGDISRSTQYGMSARDQREIKKII